METLRQGSQWKRKHSLAPLLQALAPGPGVAALLHALNPGPGVAALL